MVECESFVKKVMHTLMICEYYLYVCLKVVKCMSLKRKRIYTLSQYVNTSIRMYVQLKVV